MVVGSSLLNGEIVPARVAQILRVAKVAVLDDDKVGIHIGRNVEMGIVFPIVRKVVSTGVHHGRTVEALKEEKCLLPHRACRGILMIDWLIEEDLIALGKADIISLRCESFDTGHISHLTEQVAKGGGRYYRRWCGIVFNAA